MIKLIAELNIRRRAEIPSVRTEDSPLYMKIQSQIP
jgi:hypothetical protein